MNWDDAKRARLQARPVVPAWAAKGLGHQDPRKTNVGLGHSRLAAQKQAPVLTPQPKVDTTERARARLAQGTQQSPAMLRGLGHSPSPNVGISTPASPAPSARMVEMTRRANVVRPRPTVGLTARVDAAQTLHLAPRRTQATLRDQHHDAGGCGCACPELAEQDLARKLPFLARQIPPRFAASPARPSASGQFALAPRNVAKAPLTSNASLRLSGLRPSLMAQHSISVSTTRLAPLDARLPSRIVKFEGSSGTASPTRLARLDVRFPSTVMPLADRSAPVSPVSPSRARTADLSLLTASKIDRTSPSISIATAPGMSCKISPRSRASPSCRRGRASCEFRRSPPSTGACPSGCEVPDRRSARGDVLQ
jgi:hypothetical protein